MFPELTYQSPDDAPADPSTVNVILYGLSYCDHCTQGKELLSRLGVPFVATYIDTFAPEVRRPVLQKLRESSGARVIYPVLEVDGELIFGYDRAVWTKAVTGVPQKVV